MFQISHSHSPSSPVSTKIALEPLNRKELLLLLLLAGVQFTHIMDFMILMPLGSKLMRIFQIEPLDFGLLVAAYNFAAGAAGFAGAFFWIALTAKKLCLTAILPSRSERSPTRSHQTIFHF